MLPKGLRTWFKIHFFADYIFALPLFIAPKWFLSLLGWQEFDILAARLVAAALFGIGGISLLHNNTDKNTYKCLLDLKIIWSLTAIAGMTISLIQGAPKFTFLILGIFAVFSAVWIMYRTKLK